MNFSFHHDSKNRYEDILITLDDLGFHKKVDSFLFLKNAVAENFSSSTEAEVLYHYFSTVLSRIIGLENLSETLVLFEFSDQYCGGFKLVCNELSQFHVTYIVYESVSLDPFSLLDKRSLAAEILSSEFLGKVNRIDFLNGYMKSLLEL